MIAAITYTVRMDSKDEQGINVRHYWHFKTKKEAEAIFRFWSKDQTVKTFPVRREEKTVTDEEYKTLRKKGWKRRPSDVKQEVCHA